MNRRGANMVEYLIILGVVALAALFGFQSFGGSVLGKVSAQSHTVAQIPGGGTAGGATMAGGSDTGGSGDIAH
jgi:pilus assembly protein Flp/PilA